MRTLPDAAPTRQNKSVQAMLERGQRLDDLVTKSSELSSQSKMFYKTAKSTNSCCNLM